MQLDSVDILLNTEMNTDFCEGKNVVKNVVKNVSSQICSSFRYLDVVCWKQPEVVLGSCLMIKSA